MKLYTVFHLNLMFSSLEEAQREIVIQRCYWPMLKLAEKGYKLGVELTGVTLEIINHIDSTWITALRQAITAGQVELVGSGYSQLIGPLVPAEVNAWNQRLGLDVYQSLLGVKPAVALINEMAYSAGIIEHYVKAGYEAIVMEWNNPYRYHPEWDESWRYAPQIAVGTDDYQIPVIWADSIVFQKFQRYAHRQIELAEYQTFLQSRPNDSYYPLYTNDIEIFDFRPGRYKTEEDLASQGSEWDRIATLFEALASHNHEYVFPSEVLEGLQATNGGNVLQLESPEQPIPVKKQEKYNINRWALTGRGDLEINTACYQISTALRERKAGEQEAWKELCYLWSSDFRTHISLGRWKVFLERLARLKNQVEVQRPASLAMDTSQKMRAPFESDGRRCIKSGKYLTFEEGQTVLRLNRKKGLTIDQCVFKELGSAPVIGTLDHGYYDDIALSADFYTGHFVLERPNEHKITDLIDAKYEIEETPDGIMVTWEYEQEDIRIRQHILVADGKVSIRKRCSFPQRNYEIIFPMHITFLPDNWDAGSLYFMTHNGGHDLETSSFTGRNVHHTEALSYLISAKHGMGATQGQVIVGDKDKRIQVWHDPAEATLIPSFIHHPDRLGKYFLRLQYSSQAMDETFVPDPEPYHMSATFIIEPVL